MSARWTEMDLADYQARFIQRDPAPPVSYVMTRSIDSRRLIVVVGAPVTKPRQTQSDKWNLRGCVKRYREWADKARKVAGTLPTVGHLDVIAYFPLTKKAKAGEPHTVRPDSDNILKAVADALFPKNDAAIHEMRIKKRWDDGNGPRVEITVY